METNAHEMLLNDTQAWEFGCFSWSADDQLLSHTDTIQEYLWLKRNVRVIRKSEAVLSPEHVTA